MTASSISKKIKENFNLFLRKYVITAIPPVLAALGTVLISFLLFNIKVPPLYNKIEYVYYFTSVALCLIIYSFHKKFSVFTYGVIFTSSLLFIANSLNWAVYKYPIDIPSIILFLLTAYLFNKNLFDLITKKIEKGSQKEQTYGSKGYINNAPKTVLKINIIEDKILPYIRIIIPIIYSVALTWIILSLCILFLSGNEKDSVWISWLAPTGTFFSALVTVIGAVIGTYTIYLNGKEQRLFESQKFTEEYNRQEIEFTQVQQREKEQFHKDQSNKIILDLNKTYFTAISSEKIDKIDLSTLSNLSKNWEIFSSQFTEINKIKNIQIFNILNKIFSTYTSLIEQNKNSDDDSNYHISRSYQSQLDRIFDLGSYYPITETENSNVINGFNEISLSDLYFTNGWIYNLDLSQADLAKTGFYNISFCNCVLPAYSFPDLRNLVLENVISTTFYNEQSFDIEVSKPVRTVINIYSSTGVALLTSWPESSKTTISSRRKPSYITNRQYNKISEVFDSILSHEDETEYIFVMFSGVTFYQSNRKAKIIFKDCLFIRSDLSNIIGCEFINCKFYTDTNTHKPDSQKNKISADNTEINTLFGSYVPLGPKVEEMRKILNEELSDRVREKISNYLLNTRKNSDSQLRSCSLIEVSRIDSEIRDEFMNIFYSYSQIFSQYLGGYYYSRDITFSDFGPAYILLNSIKLCLDQQRHISIDIRFIQELLV